MPANTRPPILTEEMLRILGQRLASCAPGLSAHLRPGLPEAEMSAMAGQAGVRLPVEARRWWAWHDGISRDAVQYAHERQLGPHEVLLPLHEALEFRRWFRRQAEEAAERGGYDPDETWDPDWMPLSRSTGPIVCDCSVPEGSPSPILLRDAQLGEDARLVRARSFGEMVGWWIDAIDSGAWSFDRSERRWRRDATKLPAEVERSFLA